MTHTLEAGTVGIVNNSLARHVPRSRCSRELDTLRYVDALCTKVVYSDY